MTFDVATPRLGSINLNLQKDTIMMALTRRTIVAAGWFYLVLVSAVSPMTTTVHRNVTDITINGTVSVSIKTEGEVTALLVLLSPVSQQVQVSTNCKSSVEQQETGDTSPVEEKVVIATTTEKVQAPLSLPLVAGSKRQRAKLDLDDIVAVRVTGENIPALSLNVTQSPTAVGTTTSPLHVARNCHDIQEQGKEENGVYVIRPYDCCPDRLVSVYCDLQTDEGGWTVIQRRDLYPLQENFFRGWQSYVDGFGELDKEFWLGLDFIYALTNQSTYEIRFDLKDFEGESRWAKYNSFYVGSASTDYRMEVSGYVGNAKDSFTRHNGMPFATKDHESPNKCASTYKGAWWYSICHDSNLNGQYLRGQHTSYADGVNWRSWRGYYYSLKFTEMKIRPRK